MRHCINFTVKPAKKNPFKRVFYTAAILVAVELSANVAMATDIDGVFIPTVDGVHRNPTARTLEPGQLGVAIESYRSSSPLGDKAYPSDEGVRTEKLSVTTGLGLTRSLDFHLGLNGVKQEMSNETEQALFTAQKSAPEFTGATALLKLKLVDTGRFGLALAPFAESGSGLVGENSIARSRRAKAGWMSLISVGEKGVASADMHFGYRYRPTEELGDLIIRNEMFYGAAVTGHLHRTVGVFLSGQGRSIQVSRESEHVPGTDREYQALNAAEISGGLSVTLGGFSIAGYAGQRLEDSGFGYGAKSVGMKLAYAFGNDKAMWTGDRRRDRDRREQREVIADLDKAISEDSKKPATKVKKESVEIKEYDFFENVEKETKDFLSPEAQNNDHVLLTNELEEQAKDPRYKGPSEQQLRDQELAELQSAERARLKKEQEAKRLQELNDRRNAAKRLDEENKRYEQLKDELSQELQELPEFEPIEMDWE